MFCEVSDSRLHYLECVMDNCCLEELFSSCSDSPAQYFILRWHLLIVVVGVARTFETYSTLLASPSQTFEFCTHFWAILFFFFLCLSFSRFSVSRSLVSVTLRTQSCQGCCLHV